MPSKTGRRGENYFATREEGKTFRKLGVRFTHWRPVRAIRSYPNVDQRPIPQNARSYRENGRGRGRKKITGGTEKVMRGRTRRYAQKRDPIDHPFHPMTIRCQLCIP